MSSDEFYYPRGASPRDGLRRSKRISRSDNRLPRAKLSQKMRAKVEKKSPLDKKLLSTKVTKEKSNEIPDKRESSSPSSSCDFSGEPLSPAELHQLMVKFTTDRHFRYNPSPRPVFVSRSGDGNKNGTTSRMTNRVGDATATVTSQRSSTENNVERNNDISSHQSADAVSVTLSNPLPNASGSTLRINTSMPHHRYVPPDLLSRDDNNGSRSTIRRNFLSSGSYRARSELSSDSNYPAASAKKHLLASTGNRFNQMIHESTNSSSVPWKPFGQFNNPQVGYGGNAESTWTSRSVDREIIGNVDSYGNNSRGTRLPSMPFTRNDNNARASFNQLGTAPAADSFQSRQPSSTGNLTFPVLNPSSYGNLSNRWNNGTAQIVSNNFPSDDPSTNPIDSQRSINWNLSSSVIGYNNLELDKSLIYNCTYGITENENSTIGNCNNPSGYHSSSLIPWNNVQAFPHSTGSELFYSNGTYGCPISSDVSAPSAIVNEPSNCNDQTSYWSQNNSSTKGFFVINSNDDASSTNVASNSTNATATPAVTTTTTMTNESAELTIINHAETDKSSFNLDDFPDSQDGDFCPTVSSICSYDDDIVYGNYIDDNLAYNDNPVYNDNLVYNDNFVSTTTTTVNRELSTSLLTKIKTEVRPLYDTSNNYSRYNNDFRLNNGASILRDFDTKRDPIDSSDCVIVENPTVA